MKKTIFLLVMICLFFSLHTSFAEDIHLGEGFEVEKETDINKIISNPEKYFNKTLKTRGVIASTCKDSGCFIDIWPMGGGAEGILVNFPDAKIKFPFTSPGHLAIVEGLFYQKIYPKERVGHWHAHSFRDKGNIGEYSKILRMEARGVELLDAKETIPPDDHIRPHQEKVVDLGLTEFETNGFGTGLKCLAPKEVTPPHSTKRHQEMIFGLKERLSLILNEKEVVDLKPGSMAFLPEDTLHSIENRSKKDACYLFVFRKK